MKAYNKAVPARSRLAVATVMLGALAAVAGILLVALVLLLALYPALLP